MSARRLFSQAHAALEREARGRGLPWIVFGAAVGLAVAAAAAGGFFVGLNLGAAH